MCLPKEIDRPCHNVLSNQIAGRYRRHVVLFRETGGEGALARTWFPEQEHAQNRFILGGALFRSGYVHVGW